MHMLRGLKRGKQVKRRKFSMSAEKDTERSASGWQEVIVPFFDSASRPRLDAWLATVIDGMSRSKVQEMIEAGNVRVNRVKIFS